MPKPRSMRERRGWAFSTAVALLKPALLATTRHEWVDGEKIPAEGGFVLAANHVSHLDPLTLAHVVYDHGRLPRYLAKASLFETPLAGAIIRATGQIPVHRMTSTASQAFDSAVQAVQEGKMVIVYPEGTLTRDPDLWPMVGRTGAARIALAARVPVIPLANWGTHHILYPYATKPDLIPRKLIRIKVGDPVDLHDLRDQPITQEVLREATERIMADITGLLEDLRGEQAPAQRFDPKRAGISAIGNPHAERRKRRRRGR